MKKDFWLDRWDTDIIGFHRKEYSPFLVEFWNEFCSDKKPVFIPMCGKTRDILFFRELGHDVYGIEFSEKAVVAFFEENNLSYEVESSSRFKVFKGAGITLFCGDFFDLEKEDLLAVGSIYDRASLIALPKKTRERYAEWFSRELKNTAVFLETISFDDSELGPPFSVPSSWVESHYSHLSRREILVQDEVREIHGGKTTSFRVEINFLSPLE